MKLLLDQNISHRLVKPLCEHYPNSAQVAFLNMDSASDREIWEYAREEGYSIVTHDADFHEYSLLNGGPPLVLWIKGGNQPKSIILKKLVEYKHLIESAELNPDVWCLALY